MPPVSPTADRLRLLAAFAAVYLIWSSTYLAIRIGVHDLPPLLLAGVRFVLAGLLLLIPALALGQRIPRTWRDWLPVLVTGLMFVVLGNGLVTWAEQWVPSNQTALIVTSSALWIAWFGTLGPRGVSLSGRVKLGLATGFAGAVLMLAPQGGFGTAFRMEFLGAKLVLLLSTLCWGAGTAYRRHVIITTPPLLFAALHMLAGGLLLVLGGLSAGELSRWQWTLPGIGALVYLTLFGSCLAYVAYIWLMDKTSPAMLSTVSYVNPALALLLGWWVLDETLTGSQWLGIGVLFAGVLLVTLPSHRQLRRDTA